MDELGQVLVYFGFAIAFIAGLSIWAIHDRSVWRKRSTAHEFNRIKGSVLSVVESLNRLDEDIRRIECRVEQRSDSSSWDVRTLRSNLAYDRRELTRIASTAERDATEALRTAPNG
jgi:hypothetical protein